jgi:hypothetical protein
VPVQVGVTLPLDYTTRIFNPLSKHRKERQPTKNSTDNVVALAAAPTHVTTRGSLENMLFGASPKTTTFKGKKANLAFEVLPRLCLWFWVRLTLCVRSGASCLNLWNLTSFFILFLAVLKSSFQSRGLYLEISSSMNAVEVVPLRQQR